jgi:hypothetical protein
LDCYPKGDIELGQAKAEQMEAWDRGYYSSSEHVCWHCFDDPDIKDFIRVHATHSSCDFCGAVSPNQNISVPLHDVSALVHEAMHLEWGNPNDEGVSWESREGGWQGATYDTEDVLLSLPLEVDGKLFDAISESFVNQEWCQSNFYMLLPQQQLIFDWDHFCTTVKHRVRFLLSDYPEESDRHYGGHTSRPGDVLKVLGNVFQELSLISSLSAGSNIYRARLHSNSTSGFIDMASLGPPPASHAKYSNRMSPAGIPLFYGSLDQQTAIAEIWRNANGYVATVGRFECARDLTILDLTRIPAIPGIFNIGTHPIRSKIIFLNKFLDDFCKPVPKDGMEHIEFIPTQIVTESCRIAYEQQFGIRLDGIAFPSAARASGVSVALFGTHVNDATNAPNLVRIDSMLSLPNGNVEEVKL